MPLPKDLKPLHIAKAVEYVEKQTADLVDLYLEQANVFSAIVGIFGVKALHAVSPYKKHKHPDVAQQRFPDLSLSGKLNPPPEPAPRAFMMPTWTWLKWFLRVAPVLAYLLPPRWMFREPAGL